MLYYLIWFAASNTTRGRFCTSSGTSTAVWKPWLHLFLEEEELLFLRGAGLYRILAWVFSLVCVCVCVSCLFGLHQVLFLSTLKTVFSGCVWSFLLFFWNACAQTVSRLCKVLFYKIHFWRIFKIYFYDSHWFREENWNFFFLSLCPIQGSHLWIYINQKYCFFFIIYCLILFYFYLKYVPVFWPVHVFSRVLFSGNGNWNLSPLLCSNARRKNIQAISS